ncbi:hypothetical protein B0T14DRAFT_149229 [Immersiella caudata]|uniref:Uncharacterized protein n=1 Tax=Immersiella caudata TaxID=314043 RepID=A0AA39WVT4_9PEZI|nr:hypothetical protein B0T14DRAFT_149229 [Immersiella caudata]
MERPCCQKERGSGALGIWSAKLTGCLVLDKLWWDWQARDLPVRLRDISGRNVDAPLGQPPNVIPDLAGLPVFFPATETFPPLDTLISPPRSPLPKGGPGKR